MLTFGIFDLPPATALVLFAGACLGHLALMVRSHNFWYGLPMPKRVGDVSHALHGLFVAAFPFALWAVCGGDPRQMFGLSSEPSWQPAAAGYVALCWAVGFVALPLITLHRLRRREPPAVVGSRSRVVD